jgi:hypothetical protein
MEAVRTSQTPAYSKETTRHYIPGGSLPSTENYLRMFLVLKSNGMEAVTSPDLLFM